MYALALVTFANKKKAIAYALQYLPDKNTIRINEERNDVNIGVVMEILLVMILKLPSKTVRKLRFSMDIWHLPIFDILSSQIHQTNWFSLLLQELKNLQLFLEESQRMR